MWRSSLMKFSVCSAATPEQELNLAAEKRWDFLYLVHLEHHARHVGSQPCLALALPSPTHFMLTHPHVNLCISQWRCLPLCSLFILSCWLCFWVISKKERTFFSSHPQVSQSAHTAPPSRWLLVFRSHLLNWSLCSFICSRNCSLFLSLLEQFLP